MCHHDMIDMQNCQVSDNQKEIPLFFLGFSNILLFDFDDVVHARVAMGFVRVVM